MYATGWILLIANAVWAGVCWKVGEKRQAFFCGVVAFAIAFTLPTI